MRLYMNAGSAALGIHPRDLKLKLSPTTVLARLEGDALIVQLRTMRYLSEQVSPDMKVATRRKDAALTLEHKFYGLRTKRMRSPSGAERFEEIPTE